MVLTNMAPTNPKPQEPSDPALTIRLSTGTLGKVLIPLFAAALGALGGHTFGPPAEHPTKPSPHLAPSGPRTAADRAWCDEIVARATWHARLDAANKVCSSIPDERTKRLIFECSTIFGTLAAPHPGALGQPPGAIQSGP